MYWVRDGVVVDKERLVSEPTHCSVACFILADGLSSDAGTFRLLESEERKQRVETAQLAIVEELGRISDASPTPMKVCVKV